MTIYLADAQGQAITTISWPISARNAGKPVTLPIEKRYVEANVGKTLQVYYTAQAPRSAPRRSGVVTLLIKEGFTAAQALNLASRRYVVFFDEHNLARTPPTIPDYARYTRAQPGATAYRVDNTDIARVDPDGQVSVWGNGDITVTAQNAAGPVPATCSVCAACVSCACSARHIDPPGHRRRPRPATRATPCRATRISRRWHGSTHRRPTASPRH
ncbi:hypothetical protein NWF32_30370 [Pseudomonas qingdaonensis]|nr:hypothetical protein [Pseudomonas qingdaonensis]